MQIRYAQTGDIDALLDLRNHYVAHSFATFDEQPHDHASIAAWMGAYQPTGPHRLLVAHDDSRLLGYCCSQVYRPHPSFRHTIETSIYVAPDAGRSGVGSALYRRLFELLAHEDLHRAVVGIALPNDASVRLHEKFGFAKVGIFNEYAIKNGRRISSLWMEKHLQPTEKDFRT